MRNRIKFYPQENVCYLLPIQNAIYKLASHWHNIITVKGTIIYTTAPKLNKNK